MELEKVVQGRTITVYDSSNQTVYKFETDTDKWSDVSNMLDEEGVDLSKREAILKSTQAILKLPDASIPEGNQIIFLKTTKLASGSKDFDSMGYTDLRRAAKGLPGYEKLGANPTKKDLLSILKSNPKYKEAKPKVKKEVIKEYKKVAEETRPDLEERLKALESLVATQNATLVQFFSFTTSLGKQVSSTKITEVKQLLTPASKIKEEDTSKEALEREFKKLKF